MFDDKSMQAILELESLGIGFSSPTSISAPQRTSLSASEELGMLMAERATEALLKIA